MEATRRIDVPGSIHEGRASRSASSISGTENYIAPSVGAEVRFEVTLRLTPLPVGPTRAAEEPTESAQVLVSVVNVGGDNYGQASGDYAHQTQNIGASAEHLREMISSLAELVTTLVPDATEVVEQREEALAAVKDGVSDEGVLRRFADWVLSTVGKGASAAVLPVVTAGTDGMLQEVGRLTGHL